MRGHPARLSLSDLVLGNATCYIAITYILPSNKKLRTSSLILQSEDARGRALIMRGALMFCHCDVFHSSNISGLGFSKGLLRLQHECAPLSNEFVFIIC